MFHVLIVDDESSVTESLLLSVPWEELGFRVVGTPSDGAAALDIARRERIDAAILDIRMPGISGLELCERLRELNRETRLIIISGCAEFAYAQKAIQYGVLGYCLKPLDPVQIIRLLRRTAQELNESRRVTARDDLTEILERQDGEEIREALSWLGFSGDACYAAVSTGKNKLEALERMGICLRVGRRQWGYILRGDPSDVLRGDGLSGCLGVGLMPQPVSGREIFHAFGECSARAWQFFVRREDKICSALNEEDARFWILRIQDRLRAGDRKGADSLLEEIASRSGRCFTARSALRLGNMILAGPSGRSQEDSYIFSVEQMVGEYGDFQTLIAQLRTRLRENDAGETEGRAFTNTAFMKLMRYVNENYREEISLTSAAQALHMNSNYVSQLFKKEAGVTFVRYITQRRLEDAKVLLTTTQRPLTEIALEVGFSDAFYFIKTFKKYTGMTPGQYRENS